MLEYATPGAPIAASVPYCAPVWVNPGPEIPVSDLAHEVPELSPDQIHLGLWTTDSVLMSWATGLGQVRPPVYLKATNDAQGGRGVFNAPQAVRKGIC